MSINKHKSLIIKLIKSEENKIILCKRKKNIRVDILM